MEFLVPPPPTVDEAISDLHARFLNLPAGEAPAVERIFFQIQQAHWFYVDNWADPECWDEETSDTGGDATDGAAPPPERRAGAKSALRTRNARSVLPYLRFDAFSRRMFAASPMLRDFCGEHAKFKAAFKAYCNTIPRYGVILVNGACDHVLLVQAHGSRSYGWPRGKLNQDEAPIDCAAREAREETGFNPRSLLRDEDFLEVRDKDGGCSRLYIAVGVPDDGFHFAPQMAKEIDDIAWVQLASIEPAGRAGIALTSDGGTKRVRLWLTGFIVKLRAWIAQRAHGGSSKTARRAARVAAAAAEAAAATSAAMGGSGGSGKVTHSAARAAGVAAAAMPGGGVEGGSAVAAPLATKGGWSVEDMFASNERILGRAFTYDGNPHTFGDYVEDITASSGVRPVRTVPTDDGGSDSAQLRGGSATQSGGTSDATTYVIVRQKPRKSGATHHETPVGDGSAAFTFDRGRILSALTGSA
jgi:mRNA-decapping enzyme subunit 2